MSQLAFTMLPPPSPEARVVSLPWQPPVGWAWRPAAAPVEAPPASGTRSVGITTVPPGRAR